MLRRASKVGRKSAWISLGLLSRRPAVAEVALAGALATNSATPSKVRAVRGPAFIDPQWGYVIGARGHLIEDSIRTNWPGKAPWTLAMPTIATIRGNWSPVGHQSTLETAISLRHWYEWNYFHFHFDVLGKLSLFGDERIARGARLVVGPYVDDVPFARQIMGIGGLKELNWSVQTRESVTWYDAVYYSRARGSFFDRIGYVLDLMKTDNLPTTDQRRLFLTRPDTATRRIVNSGAVRSVLESFGFDTVDTSRMPVTEQIALFRSARFIVANHGAGLTNIVYRRGSSLDVMELYGRYNSFEFETICSEFGYSWHGLAGASEPGWQMHADFTVDVRALVVAVEHMLKSAYADHSLSRASKTTLC